VSDLWVAAYLIGGLVLLVIGGDVLVRGAVTIAKRLGLSPFMIGLTLVGFGTSTPELVTSLHAAFVGAPGIAVGNVVGSNIANVLLILGLTAIAAPIATPTGSIRRDGVVMMIASFACLAVVLIGFLDRWSGILLLVILITYLAVTAVLDRRRQSEVGAGDDLESAGSNLLIAVAFVVGGLLATVFGARLLVTGAIVVAREAGISETVIGLTLVALGTSLPELVTSVIAALKKHSDVAFGNVVGSNIFNLLFILGTTAVVKPIAVPPEIVRLDIWVMLGSSLLLILFAATGRRINRIEGAGFFACYLLYTGYLLHLS